MVVARAAGDTLSPLSFCRRGVGTPLRLVLLALLGAAELSHFGLPVLAGMRTNEARWWWPILWGARPIVEAALGAVLVTIFLSWPVFIDELRSHAGPTASDHRNRWLAIHLVCAGCAGIWLALGMGGEAFTQLEGDLWFFSGALILIATAATWCAALLPFSFWSNWLARSPGAFAAGATIGILARSAGYIARMFPALQHYTFVTVATMLWMIGQQVVVDPARALLGTPHFSVYMAPACSGVEGIGLITIFLIGYLWLFRSELRFPQSLILLPAGIALIWVLNAVRITALILLGGSLTRLALEGFHSVAGWILFNTTALGLVVSSRRVGLFAKAKAQENMPLDINSAASRLVPLMVTIATAMITGAFFRGFDYAYPLRVIFTGAALWLYCDRFKELLWGWSWSAVAVGVLGFILWIAIGWQGQSAASSTIFVSGLHSLPPTLSFLWIVFRFAGAVVTVPLAEELAFRSYLMRKLVSSEFDSVDYKQVTWSAVAVSSILFGLLHQNWIAAIIAGVIYATAAKRRGRLSDAVCAHATTNAILALFVVITGQWSLWN